MLTLSGWLLTHYASQEKQLGHSVLEPIFTEEEEERGMTIPGVQDLLNEKVGSLSTFQTLPKCAQKILLEAGTG